MHMKKLLCLLLAAAMVLALAACGTPAEDPENTEAAESPENAGQEGESGEEPGDSDETVRSYSDGFDERGFFEGVVASEIVTLPEYKGIAVPKEPSEEGVRALIDEVLAYYPLYEQITDRPLEDLDTVNIDYVGSVDGVEFDGGSTGGYGTTVTIGVTSYIDDFLEQLIGHMPGENFDIEVTFPDPYLNNTDLSGAEAVFNVTINYIQGEQLERELDEEIAFYEGFDSVEELMDAIRDVVLSEEQSAAIDAMLSETQCGEIPQPVMDTLRNLVVINVEENAAAYGLTAEELLGYSGYAGLDDYLADNEAYLREDAAFYLAVQAIAETEGLEVTVEDIAEAGAESAVDYYGAPYVRFILLYSVTVTDFILENSVGE